MLSLLLPAAAAATADFVGGATITISIAIDVKLAILAIQVDDALSRVC